MTRINLLPWREVRRVQQQREFVSMLVGAIMVAALGVIGTHMNFAGRIDYQEARNQYLQDEITRLKKIEKDIEQMEMTKARLLDHLNAIRDLQRVRPLVVRVYDELVRRLPEDIFLKSLNSNKDTLILKGTALSNNTVSEFLRELEQSSWFVNPRLTVINNLIINRIRASEFELAVNRVKPKNKDAEESDEETN